MKVLALDPGYDKLGVAVLTETETGIVALEHSGCIRTASALSHEKRLLSIGESLGELMDKHGPAAVALESLFFNANVTTGIKVAEVRGVILFLAAERGLPVHEYTPQEVKVAATGYGRSDKASVFAMVKRLVRGVPEGKEDDEYDAIAVGLTALSHKGVRKPH